VDGTRCEGAAATVGDGDGDDVFVVVTVAGAPPAQPVNTAATNTLAATDPAHPLDRFRTICFPPSHAAAATE
jgi:hypothetical protein